MLSWPSSEQKFSFYFPPTTLLDFRKPSCYEIVELFKTNNPLQAAAESDPCHQRKCTSNEHCCDGMVCVDTSNGGMDDDDSIADINDDNVYSDWKLSASVRQEGRRELLHGRRL